MQQQKEKRKNGFCAVNNSEVLLFNKDRLPIITSLNKISNLFPATPLKEIVLNSGLQFQEFIFDEPVFIHSVNTKDEIGLNRIKSIVEYKNLNNVHRVQPFLLKSFETTINNSIFTDKLEVTNIDLQNINNQGVLKSNKYFGKKISEVSGFELDMNFGYIMGQFFSRGYIDKSKKGCNTFTWVSLEEGGHKLNNLIMNTLKSGTFHRGKEGDEKYDYIQLMNFEVNERLTNSFVSNKLLNSWIYSAPYSFLNGLIYGIFFTNGSFSFNKTKTKAYMTIKFLNHSLAEKFTDLLNIRFNIQGTISLVPDKKYCKVSYRLNTSIFKILENGFEYGYIINENKKKLLDEIKEIITLEEYDNNPVSTHQFKIQKVSQREGYNFKVYGCKGFALLNNILVPSL
jgi:hypothetical protein